MSILDILGMEWPSVVLGVTIFLVAVGPSLLMETLYHKRIEPWLLAIWQKLRSRLSRRS